MKKYFTTFVLTTLFFTPVFAQNVKVDSLEKLLTTNLADSRRAFVLSELMLSLRESDPIRALDFGEKANVLTQKVGSSKQQSGINHNLANIYLFLGRYPEAIKKSLEALKIWEQNADKSGMNKALSTLGTIYYDMGDLDKSLEFHQRSLGYAEIVKDSTGICIGLGKIGNIFDRRNQADKALECYKKALTIAEKPKYNRLLASTSTNLGNFYVQKKDFERALFFYEQALKLNLQSSKNIGLPYNYGNISGLLVKLNRIDEAVLAAEKSLEAAQKLEGKKAIKFAFQTLSAAYEAKKDFEKAFFYYEKFYNVTDSLNNADRQRSVLELQTKYETEKKEQQILFLEKMSLQERQFADQKLKEERLILGQQKDKALALMAQGRRFDLQLLAEKQEKEQALSDSEQRQKLNSLMQQKEREAAIFALQDGLRRKQMLGLVLGLLGVVGLLGFIFVQNRKIKRKNTQLEAQNQTISQQSTQLETMMREIHHRVKNNLQVINSLLSLQTRSEKNEQALEALRDSQSRVKSMALIHNKLYQNERVDRIDFQEYATELCKSILTTFKTDKEIVLNIKADGIQLNIDTAVPVGLILNELITNALKYAYENVEKGILNVEILRGPAETSYKLKVSDNGCGLPLDFDYKKTNSVGLKLVNNLTRQLEGTWEALNQNGAAFVVSFKEMM